MPEETGVPFICSLKMQVATGPVTAEAMMGGIQIRGFFTILPICSMEVPSPWEIRPPHLFSRKLITAKPTILAQQPATACQSGEGEGGADGCGGDGEGQCDANQYRDDDPHQERL